MDAIVATGLAGGRLRVVRLLGEGGMGRVYEAFDRDLRLPVAIKMMRNPTPEGLLRLKTEFRALKDLSHPNLVKLGELFLDREHCFFSMELVDGVDFLDHVFVRASPRRRRGGTTVSGSRPVVPPLEDDVWDADTMRLEVLYDEARLRAAIRQVAEGLDALHRAGKVHRDLKPGNVLITADGRAVVLDLGLTVDVAEAAHVGTIEGTVEYMAPEQAAGAAADPAADMYALGAVLYEALTGRPPYVGEPLQILRDKQRLDVIAPGAMFVGVPHDLEELCLALLRRDPAARPSARAVADGL
ncbi:MAG: serine/threonine protein kinase, partial [Myxococcales bacterium]|nr:serine/threonine protein kinase [Myxococcales bacterium]